jgi:hypothetical protein
LRDPERGTRKRPVAFKEQVVVPGIEVSAGDFSLNKSDKEADAARIGRRASDPKVREVDRELSGVRVVEIRVGAVEGLVEVIGIVGLQRPGDSDRGRCRRGIGGCLASEGAGAAGASWARCRTTEQTGGSDRDQ